MPSRVDFRFARASLLDRSIEIDCLTVVSKSTRNTFTMPGFASFDVALAISEVNTASRDFFAAAMALSPMLPELSTMKAML
ncbi:hypothetical protein D3C76_1486450 [compost metagenome]